MRKLAAAILILFLCMSSIYAEDQSKAYNIQINVASRTLRLFDHEILIKEYPIAVGKPATKTPLGSYKIINKAANPVWNNKGNPVAPGLKNPLGIRWMGISIPSGTYGIHGNNTPASIGTSISGGCIRMYNNDVEELYSLVNVSTPVKILYESIEVRRDKYTDSTVFIVYPDIYKKKDAVSLLKQLEDAHKEINREQSARAAKLVQSNISRPAAVCQGTAVMLNEQFATNDAFIENNQVYIYYLAASELLGFDEEILTSVSASILERSNKAYINLTEAASKAGGQIKIDNANDNVYLSLPLVKVNGKYLCTYSGSFDKEYLMGSDALNRIGISSAAGSGKAVNLKELCKQQGWVLRADSLNKIMSIDVPLRVKIGDTYISAEYYQGKYYIDSEAAADIPGISSKNLNQYAYQTKVYYDVNEVMEFYDCSRDEYFTTIEVMKPLSDEAQSQ